MTYVAPLLCSLNNWHTFQTKSPTGKTMKNQSKILAKQPDRKIEEMYRQKIIHLARPSRKIQTAKTRFRVQIATAVKFSLAVFCFCFLFSCFFLSFYIPQSATSLHPPRQRLWRRRCRWVLVLLAVCNEPEDALSPQGGQMRKATCAKKAKSETRSVT